MGFFPRLMVRLMHLGWRAELYWKGGFILCTLHHPSFFFFLFFVQEFILLTSRS